MTGSILVYVVLAVSGLLGSAIAWDDLKAKVKGYNKPVDSNKAVKPNAC